MVVRELDMQRVQFLHGPKELKLELTSLCPLNCSHCSADAGKSKVRHLSYENAACILSSFSEMGGKDVVFTGGEPLCHDHVLPLAALVKELSLNVLLYTTGRIEKPIVKTHSEFTEIIIDEVLEPGIFVLKQENHS